MAPRRRIGLFLAASAALWLGGCGSSIGNLDAFIPVPLQNTEFMPPKEAVKSGTSKVVLFKVDDTKSEAGKRAGVGEALYVELARELTQNGTVEILDREIADRLEDEVKLAELSGKTEMSDDALAVAQYAVAVQLGSASFQSRYIAPVKWLDKSGLARMVPAHYIYTASVSGLIKIYAIPSMKIVKTIELSDNKSRTENSLFLQKAQQFDAGLINGAARDAVHAARIELKNFFAPKGYVMEKRADGSQQIVQVTIGSRHGLAAGESVSVYTLASSTNPLTGESEVTEKKIAAGKVSNRLDPDRAWILVDEENPQMPIRLGDYVRVEYSKGTLDYLNDFARGYNTLIR